MMTTTITIAIVFVTTNTTIVLTPIILTPLAKHKALCLRLGSLKEFESKAFTVNFLGEYNTREAGEGEKGVGLGRK